MHQHQIPVETVDGDVLNSTAMNTGSGILRHQRNGGGRPGKAARPTGSPVNRQQQKQQIQSQKKAVAWDVDDSAERMAAVKTSDMVALIRGGQATAAAIGHLDVDGDDPLGPKFAQMLQVRSMF